MGAVVETPLRIFNGLHDQQVKTFFWHMHSASNSHWIEWAPLLDSICSSFNKSMLVGHYRTDSLLEPYFMRSSSNRLLQTSHLPSNTLRFQTAVHFVVSRLTSKAILAIPTKIVGVHCLVIRVRSRVNLFRTFR